MATRTFGARNDSPSFARFFERFYLDFFFPKLKELGIGNIIQMGDVFDRRKYINFLTLHECRRYFFEQVWKGGFEYDGLIGNHDTYYKNTNRVNSPAILLGEYSERIRFYSRPSDVQLGGSLHALMLPWICEDNYHEALAMIHTTKATVAFGHLELQGFEMYKGQRIDLQHALTADLFSKFDVVVSGHFHHPQVRGNIRYVGSPYEITWSDYDDPKGFHILDTETLDMEFVPNPFRMFEKIQYNDIDKDTAQVCTVDFEQYRDKYIKVIVTNKTNPYAFDTFIDKLEKAGVSEVQVVDDHFHMDKPSDEEIFSEAEDTLSIIGKSIAQLDSSIDKPSLEVLMRDLYSEALRVE